MIVSVRLVALAAVLAVAAGARAPSPSPRCKRAYARPFTVERGGSPAGHTPCPCAERDISDWLFCERQR
jgi:hypothetical protein